MLKYDSVYELVNIAAAKNKKISEIVLEDQAVAMEESEDALYKRMENSFDVMIESVQYGMSKNIESTSGLTKGDGYKMNTYADGKNSLCGNAINKVMARAVSVSLCNAAMGKIVATPTAGSCGILPACLISLYEDRGFDKRDIVMSIFTAAAFGMVIANNACIAGANGGCQAECGSAAGMAAAALTELMGGTPAMCADACAISINNQLGLVCDPVAGLVEIPCIKRNVSGAMIAMSSADMVLAGLISEIPVDECIIAMREVGDAMHSSLKETAMGGLAATPTAIKIKNQIFGK